MRALLSSLSRPLRIAATVALVGVQACTPAGPAPQSAQDLPAEAVHTLTLIAQGGPFPYRRDGVVFHNRERLLPLREQGFYREYTVPTPGAKDRGARRIVAGGQPPEIYYYTADHYRSFREIELKR